MKALKDMNKEELRQACRKHGISYGKLNNDGMRQALIDSYAPEQPKVDHSASNKLIAKAMQAEQKPVNNVMASIVAQATGTSVMPESSKTTKPAQLSGLKIEKNRDEQNGIKRPSAGGLCRAVWDHLDEVLAKTGESAQAKDVKAWAESKGHNVNNASIELYQWRKFMGLNAAATKK